MRLINHNFISMKNLFRVVIMALSISIISISSIYAYNYSFAPVTMGSTSLVIGAKPPLLSKELIGDLYSTSSSTGTSSQRLYGYMKTKGVIWTVLRDSASVAPGCADALYWANSDGETGTYWAEAKSPNGNHYGQCEVFQY